MSKGTVELVKKTVVIERVGPYGVLVGGEWLGVNEPLTPKDFEAGRSYDVLTKTSVNKVGKEKTYIAQIVGSKAVTSIAWGTTESQSSAKTVTTDYKAEQVDKNTSIKRQGLVQAALQSPGLAAFAMNKEEYLKLVFEVAEAGVQFVEKR